MKAFDLLHASLGAPLFAREIRVGGEPIAALGRWRHSGASVDFDGVGSVQVVFNVSGGQVVERESRGRKLRGVARAGSVAVVDPRETPRVSIAGDADTVQFAVSDALIARAVAETPKDRTADATAVLQGQSARTLVALTNGAIKEPDLERIARAVAAAAVRQMASDGGERRRGGLSARRRRLALTAMGEPSQEGFPTVGQLAEVAGVSLFHFVRAFRQSLGQTPGAYMATLRFDAALERLLQPGTRVDEIADALGYASPSHFVAEFRKRFGVTPGALRDAAAA
jgi:AraC family transcriptional regulator